MKRLFTILYIVSSVACYTSFEGIVKNTTILNHGVCSILDHDVCSILDHDVCSILDHDVCSILDHDVC